MRWKIGVLILLGFVLTACGNKGPLVMPDAVDDNKKVERELTK